MPDHASITVRCISGASVGNAQWRLFVDGIPRTTFQIGEEVVVPTSPGRHALSVQGIMWGSGIEMVMVQPGEQIVFECRNAFWRDWQKRQTRFWWAAPFLGSIFSPCLVRVDGTAKSSGQSS